MRRWLVALALSLVSAPMLGPATAAAEPSQIGEWGPVLSFGGEAVHAALLHTGKVLMWRQGANARVWDPATGEITPVPTPASIPSNTLCAALVHLADGRVVQIGGQHISAAAAFDPQTMKWTPLATMHYQRWYPTATVLSDGRVLVANGEDSSDQPVLAVEVYDPATDTWTVLPGADRRETVYSHHYLLPNGKVYQATPKEDTWLLDLSSNSWLSGPTSGWQTAKETESAAMYLPGKIIRSGGTPITPINLSSTMEAQNRAGTVDMTAISPAWQEISPMAFPRRFHNMVILADGKVMAVGGSKQGDDTAQAVLPGEIWDPATRQWTTVASLSLPRMYHSTALLLPDGRVLAGGGSYQTVGLETASTAQLYTPPYLFKGPRPGIAAAPGNLGYGTAFTISSPDAGSIASAVLIRPSATTHGNDMDQRYVPLDIQSRTASGVTVAAPANANWAPPGWYMLFIKNSNGVPSVAKWVQVSGRPTSAPEPGPGIVPVPGPGQAPAPAPGPTPTGTTAGGIAGAPAGSTSGTSSGGRLVSVTVRHRIRLRDVRHRGLTINVHVALWTDTHGRVVRVRVLRRTNGRRQVVTTISRTLRYPESFRLALRSPALRRALRPGHYEVEAAGGTSWSTLQAPSRQAFTIVR